MLSQVPIANVLVGSRQRSSMDNKDISILKESILKLGLLHAPVIRWTPEGPSLLVGERRLTAIRRIYEEGGEFSFDGRPVPKGMLPIVNVADLNPVELLEVEFEENIVRVDLTWQERVEALAAIQKAREALAVEEGRPVRGTQRDLSKEISEKSGGALKPASVQANLARAKLVSEHLRDPQVAKAKSLQEAHSIVVKKQQDRVAAAIAKRVREAAPEASDIILRQGSALDILPNLDPSSFDLILADPPYGIAADDYDRKFQTLHNYDDSPESARELLKLILVEGFRLLRQSGNLFIFTDISHFDYLQRQASAMGWRPWRTPVIWQKSLTEGLAPWREHGFKRTFEIIFFATKGNLGLYRPLLDILHVKRVHRSVREHAAEKPLELLQLLIEAATLPGAHILDPTCGSGSTLLAAKHTSRKALGIELDPDIYNLAHARLYLDADAQNAALAKLEQTDVIPDRETLPHVESSLRNNTETGTKQLEILA